MRKIMISAFILIYYAGFSQVNGTRIKENLQTQVFVDSSTNYSYVLDSTHTYITSYDACGNFLWSFYTCISNFRRSSSGDPVQLHDIRFGNKSELFSRTKADERVLLIYHDFCAGYVNLKTGKYTAFGCD